MEVFENGKKWVILDNLVLDLGEGATSYFNHHPGGKFVLEHNVGRDISKFFFGGYAMTKGMPQVHHSAMALKITEKMVIGNISGQDKVNYTNVERRVEGEDNKVTKTYALKADSTVHNWRHSYSPLNMIGRHFVLYA